MSNPPIPPASCSIIVPKEPPDEFRIFRAGVNASTKGPFLFDAKAAKLTMAAFDEMGRRCSFDYDHGSTRPDAPDPSKSSKSAGTFALEVRNGELWAVNCAWTTEAAAGISHGDWPFFSPTFAHDDEGRPTWVICVALTPNPALHGIPQLVAASLFAAAARPNPTLGAGVPPPTNPQKDTPMATKFKALRDYMSSSSTSKSDACKAMGMKLSELDDTGDDAEMSAAQEEAFKKMRDSKKDPPAAAANTYERETRTVDLRAFGATLGVTDPDATAVQVLAAASEHRSATIQLLSVTGEKTVAGALARIAALVSFGSEILASTKQASLGDAAMLVGELVATRAEVKEQQKKAREERVTSLLSAAQREGKIVPAEVEGPHGLRVLGMENPDRLEAQLKARAPHAALGAALRQLGEQGTGSGAAGAEKFVGKKYEQLSNIERAELANTDAIAFASLRADWDARGKPPAPKSPAAN